jgi:hypothetical protein
MNLRLVRTAGRPGYVPGKLFVDGKFECYTLEDQMRTQKIYAQTAIPLGRYRIIVTYSNRFKRPLPLLLNVPEFTGVRIHSGNTVADTEGCILVGDAPSAAWLGQSGQALARLAPKINVALERHEEVWIDIVVEA